MNLLWKKQIPFPSFFFGKVTKFIQIVSLSERHQLHYERYVVVIIHQGHIPKREKNSKFCHSGNLVTQYCHFQRDA